MKTSHKSDELKKKRKKEKKRGGGQWVLVTKIRIFFQQHWESEYFFMEKNHTPTPPFSS